MKKLLGICLFPFYFCLWKLFSKKGHTTIVTFHNVEAHQQEKFSKLIDFYDKNFNIVHPNDFLSGNLKNKRNLLITFDDGFLSSYEATKNYLYPRNISALHFICANFNTLENEQLKKEFVSKNLHKGNLDISKVSPAQMPMDVEQVKDMINNKQILGSHTMNHCDLGEVSSDYYEVEINQSKKRLEELYGETINSIAYPFGSINNIAKEALKEIKKSYKFCFSNVRGINSKGVHPLALRRQNIDLNQNLSFLKLISLGALDFLYKEPARKLDEMIES